MNEEKKVQTDSKVEKLLEEGDKAMKEKTKSQTNNKSEELLEDGEKIMNEEKKVQTDSKVEKLLEDGDKAMNQATEEGTGIYSQKLEKIISEKFSKNLESYTIPLKSAFFDAPPEQIEYVSSSELPYDKKDFLITLYQDKIIKKLFNFTPSMKQVLLCLITVACDPCYNHMRIESSLICKVTGLSLLDVKEAIVNLMQKYIIVADIIFDNSKTKRKHFSINCQFTEDFFYLVTFFNSFKNSFDKACNYTSSALEHLPDEDFIELYYEKCCGCSSEENIKFAIEANLIN